MILNDLFLFNGNAHFCKIGISIRKIVKTVDVSETIAASDLKVDKFWLLIEFMKGCEYSKSMSFFQLGPRSFPYEY